MANFDQFENTEYVATQALHYDRYESCQYFLERVEVEGRCGLVCGETLEGYGVHSRMLLEPLYEEIQVRKISSPKAIYDRYAVYGDGNQLGTFTLVLNSWVPR